MKQAVKESGDRSGISFTKKAIRPEPAEGQCQFAWQFDIFTANSKGFTGTIH